MRLSAQIPQPILSLYHELLKSYLTKDSYKIYVVKCAIFLTQTAHKCTCRQGCSGKLGFGGALVKYFWGTTMTEGPERGAEARSARATRGWGLGRGTVAPHQYRGLGAMPPEKFSTNQP